MQYTSTIPLSKYGIKGLYISFVILRTKQTAAVARAQKQLLGGRTLRTELHRGGDRLDAAGALGGRHTLQPSVELNCPSRKSPVLAVDRHARPDKSAIEKRFTVENAKAA
jgi:hypothetical protein